MFVQDYVLNQPANRAEMACYDTLLNFLFYEDIDDEIDSSDDENESSEQVQQQPKATKPTTFTQKTSFRRSRDLSLSLGPRDFNGDKMSDFGMFETVKTVKLFGFWIRSS